MDNNPSADPEFSVNDQIASLYLRGKNVNCLSCGYNRKNGAGSACPECGKDLVLTLSDRLDESQYKTLARVCLISITILASFQALQLLYWYIMYIQFYNSLQLDTTVVIAGLSFIAWSLLAATPLVILLKARKHNNRVSLHATITPLISFVLLTFVLTLFWGIFTAFTS